MNIIYSKNTKKMYIINNCNSSLVINNRFLMDEEESRQFNNLPTSIIDNFNVYYGDLGYELYRDVDINYIKEFLINVNIHLNDENSCWYKDKITDKHLYSYDKVNKRLWVSSYNILSYFKSKSITNDIVIEYICEAILVEHYKWKVDKLI
jgi:hypothetical protein